MKFIKYKEQCVVNLEKVNYFHKGAFLKTEGSKSDMFYISFKSNEICTWNFLTKEERDMYSFIYLKTMLQRFLIFK